jgi:hypothetical protein
MGDFRIQQTWKREGNHNKTTHLEFHACLVNKRHDERAALPRIKKARNATQRNLRPESGKGALPDRRSASRAGLSVGHPID